MSSRTGVILVDVTVAVMLCASLVLIAAGATDVMSALINVEQQNRARGRAASTLAEVFAGPYAPLYTSAFPDVVIDVSYYDPDTGGFNRMHPDTGLQKISVSTLADGGEVLFRLVTLRARS